MEFVRRGHYARPVTGLNWVLDAAATERRPVTEEDVKRWVRVTHALPNIQLASSAFDQDGAPQSMEVRALGIMLQHTDKPLMVSGLSGEGMRWTSRLCEVCQGAGRHPRVAVLSSVNSPLVYGYGQAEVAMVAAELGIPVLFNSSAVSGVTAPVTLAGSLAQMNAEMLAALVIIQLTRPGAMAVYSGYPVVMDMRTGLAAFGLAEVGLLAAACIEIGRYYGLPTSSNGLTTDTCSLDAMASIEKWNSGYLPALAGANLNGGAGALASQSTISLEQLVIDDDIFGGIFRQMRGIEVNDATLAGELIHKVGPRGSFLASDHTREHYRGEYWYSPLASRVSAAVWEAAGSESVLERARDRVSAILAVPEEPLLTEEQTTDVCALVQEAERALSSLEPHV